MHHEVLVEEELRGKKEGKERIEEDVQVYAGWVQ